MRWIILILLILTVSAQDVLPLRRRVPVVAAAGGGTPVTFVSSSKGSVHNGALLSVSITNSGANTLQIVHVGKGDASFGLTASVTNQAGTAFTRLWTNNASSWSRSEMWYLVNPPTGTNTIYISQDAGDDDTGATVFCIAGAHQTVTFGTAVTAAADGNITVTVTSAAGELVVGGVSSDDESTLVIAGGGTNPSGVGVINSDTAYAAGYWTGAASVGANWTAAALPTSGGGVSIKPANP